MSIRSIITSVGVACFVIASVPCEAQTYSARSKLSRVSTTAASPSTPATPSTCGTLSANSTVSNATIETRRGPFPAANAAAAVSVCNAVAGAKVCYYDVGGKNAYVFTAANQSSVGGGSTIQMSSNCTAN